jgi:hypothetical protein
MGTFFSPSNSAGIFYFYKKKLVLTTTQFFTYSFSNMKEFSEVTGHRKDGQPSILSNKYCSVATTVYRLAVGPTQPPIQFIPGVKEPAPEAGNLLSFNVKI